VEVDAEGLAAALAELASQTTELHGVTCTFATQGPVDLANNQVATQLYSIAREAVNNALKHARAQNIEIHLETDGQSITVRVQDDGMGLPEPPRDTRGMGLKIMRYRAGLINAHLALSPAGPIGTAVICTCPEDPPHHAREQGRAE
jgi:nitrate/nitrite-specific signal transduction histidine kinase